ncbi:hypothetical protein TKK_0011699 [Trichogramma kaykai]
MPESYTGKPSEIPWHGRLQCLDLNTRSTLSAGVRRQPVGGRMSAATATDKKAPSGRLRQKRGSVPIFVRG